MQSGAGALSSAAEPSSNSSEVQRRASEASLAHALGRIEEQVCGPILIGRKRPVSL